MLRPRDTSTRERKSLNGLWQRVRSGRRGSVRPVVQRPSGAPARWRCRPASTTSPPTQPSATTSATSGTRPASGTAWLAGRRIVLHFESATHRATVWVNDNEVVSHEGGYTPFEADITEHVTGGEQVRITALVNNTLSFQSIPPGVIEDTPAGKRQIYGTTFSNAGIHRTVWLYSTDPAHITDVTIVTDLDGDTGVVDYTIEADGADDLETRVMLRNADGQEVATNTGASGTLQVPGVHKWAPGDGYLYLLEVQLVQGDTVVDSYTQCRCPNRQGGRHRS